MVPLNNHDPTPHSWDSTLYYKTELTKLCDFDAVLLNGKTKPIQERMEKIQPRNLEFQHNCKLWCMNLNNCTGKDTFYNIKTFI